MSPSPKKTTTRSRKTKGDSSASTETRIRKPEPNGAALARLDIDLDELDAAPQITEVLKGAFPKVQGQNSLGRPIFQILNYLTASDAPAAKSWLKAWKFISEDDRGDVSIEAVCVMARVNPLELLGAILVSAKNLKAQESALKAIIAHPDVVESTIKRSKGKYGFADSKLLHEAVGFLPTRHGQSIAVNINNASGGDSEESDDDDKAFDDAFPTISGNLEAWSERRRSLTDGR